MIIKFDYLNPKLRLPYSISAALFLNFIKGKNMKQKSQRLKSKLNLTAIIFALVFFILISQTAAQDAQPMVAAGGSHTVGLRSDGTVVAVGSNFAGQCNVSSWTDIMQVAAGGYHTVGLKSDGTVVAVGVNDDGQCNVSSWTDIVQVAAYRYHTVGLKSDGAVVAVGVNDDGQCNVSSWTDIMQVAAGGYLSLIHI